MEFYTTDVVEEILAMIIMNPEVYDGDGIEDAVCDYWPDYPWNIHEKIHEIMGDVTERQLHEIELAFNVEFRKICRNDVNLAFESMEAILREILTDRI